MNAVLTGIEFKLVVRCIEHKSNLNGMGVCIQSGGAQQVKINFSRGNRTQRGMSPVVLEVTGAHCQAGVEHKIHASKPDLNQSPGFRACGTQDKTFSVSPYEV